MIKWFRLFCIPLLLFGALYAQEEIVSTDYNFKREFMRMLFILGLILSMVIATTWMFRRIGRGKMKAFNSNSSIRILERRAVSAKSFLYLLEVEGTKILIGDSQAGLSGLAVLTEPPPSPPAPSEKSPFSALLREKLEKVKCTDSR